jgi:hypothetical protein
MAVDGHRRRRPADQAMLPDIVTALAESIATIADIAMDEGGLSAELAARPNG